MQKDWDAWIADPIREAWNTERTNKQLPGHQAAWEASSRPLDPGHFFAAQKAWAAEQTEKQLPVTLAAWEAWLTGPTKRPTVQPMGSAGLHQLRQKHLEDQRATQTAWVAAQTHKTGINTILPTKYTFRVDQCSQKSANNGGWLAGKGRGRI